MAKKKSPIVLNIPAEYNLTDAEKAALSETIRVHITQVLKAKGDDNAFINVPPNKLPSRKRLAAGAAKGSSPKASASKASGSKASTSKATAAKKSGRKKRQ